MSIEETFSLIHRLYPQAIEDLQYKETLQVLRYQYPFSRVFQHFSEDELHQASQRVMSHYPERGIVTMNRLMSNDRAVVRDFIRELGKVTAEESLLKSMIEGQGS